MLIVSASGMASGGRVVHHLASCAATDATPWSSWGSRRRARAVATSRRARRRSRRSAATSRSAARSRSSRACRCTPTRTTCSNGCAWDRRRETTSVQSRPRSISVKATPRSSIRPTRRPPGSRWSTFRRRPMSWRPTTVWCSTTRRTRRLPTRCSTGSRARTARDSHRPGFRAGTINRGTGVGLAAVATIAASFLALPVIVLVARAFISGELLGSLTSPVVIDALVPEPDHHGGQAGHRQSFSGCHSLLLPGPPASRVASMSGSTTDGRPAHRPSSRPWPAWALLLVFGSRGLDRSVAQRILA